MKNVRWAALIIIATAALVLLQGRSVADTTASPSDSAQYAFKGPVAITSEEVVTVYGSIAYSARYNHASDQLADDEAVGSLKTLCGGKAP